MSGSLIGPVDASRLPRIDEVLPSDVAVVGFLFDRGVSNRPGARFGPALDRIRERLGAAPIYVSVDIDVLDPAHAPGTGTPEAGGITSRELLVMLRALADLDAVSADIVEVAPAYDHAELTGSAASHVAYELLSVMSCRGSLNVR